MGYVFHVPGVTLDAATAGAVSVKIELGNRGVAPFYFDWPAELALRAPDGSLSAPLRIPGTLKGLLPGAPARVWEGKVSTSGLGSGPRAVLLRVPNPLPKGRPVRFANAAQDVDVDGWLTLGTVTLRE